jgi:hypothetical protein
MANRYTYQFNGSFKPKMSQIEGFVSIGTGGMVNFPDAYPVFPVATGATGIAGQTGAPRGLMPGQATAGTPTGWSSGFSGVVGLYGAGLAGIQRVSTGAFVFQLSDDWVRLDSIQLDILSGASGGAMNASASGALGIDWSIIDHTVGLGNSIGTGGVTGWLGAGNNPKNRIFVQFVNTVNGLPADLPLSSGFFVDIRVRDSLVGPQ